MTTVVTHLIERPTWNYVWCELRVPVSPNGTNAKYLGLHVDSTTSQPLPSTFSGD